MKPKLFLMVFMISFTGLIISTHSQAQFNEFQLIEHTTGERQDKETTLFFYEYKDAVSRFSEVSLNENIKSIHTISAEDLIVLNLFSETEYIAEVQKVEEIMEDNVTITAKLLSNDFDYMIISTTEGRSLVTIRVHELSRIYQITRDPFGLNYYLVELDLKKMIAEDELPPQKPPAPTPYDIEEQKRIKQELESKSTGPWDPATIDVMMVYTQAARTWGNDNGGIRNLVATAIADGNVILSNSNTVASFRLVHNAEVNYTESPSLRVDLRRLTTSPTIQPWGNSWTLNEVSYSMLGFMDVVHTWRNTYGADLVLLFTATGSGIGWLLEDVAGDPNYGFSISNISRLWSFTPTHEKGHNSGLHHHKEQTDAPGPTNWGTTWPANTWSAGWRWLGSDSVWYHSVMSYTWGSPNGGRVPHFSNPSINHMGQPTGHTADGNNARTLRTTKHVLAAYRSTATINCIECPGYNFSINPGNSWLTHSSSIVSGGCKIYRVAVEQGRTYTFKTGCGNGATANFDTYLEILNDNCTQVAANDDGCENYRSIITWMAPYTGYAYVKVSGWGSASGTYTMAYHRNDDLTWTGLINSNWHVPSNWSGFVVPDNTFNAIIPGGTVRQPSIIIAHAYCKNLTISTGGTLTVGGCSLYVNNDITIHGTLAMNNSSGVINAYGDVVWNSGSTANFTAFSIFNVHGNWTFRGGSIANLGNGVVAFRGSDTKYIHNYSSTSSFNSIWTYKTAGADLGISASSNSPLTINGDIYVHTGLKFGIYTSQNVFIKGNISSNGEFICNSGTVVLNGTNQSLRMNTGNYFNNLTFNQSGTVTINNALSSIVDVKNNVVIQSGVFNMQDRVVHVGGNWTNNAFPTGFNAGTGRVIFNGTGHQYVYSSENFNILEANMGAAIRINNAAHTVTCNQYDWKAGGIDVIAGTFTANDLAQNGLYGGYWVNPGGTINLTNSTGTTWVDLRGSVYIHGGTMNLTGTAAWWPYANGANFTMTGGMLDFKTCGLRIHDFYTWTYNITGGTIRTAHHYSGVRTDFSPTAGIFEFYGSSNITIFQNAGNTLHRVVINKGAARDDEEESGIPLYDERSGELLSDGGRSGAVSLGSDFTTTANLNIEAGTFSVGQHTCNIGGNTIINGTLAMTHPSGVINASGDVIWNSGSTANFTAMNVFNVYGDWNFESGSNAALGNGVVAFRGSATKYIRNYTSTSSFNNISSYKTAGADLGISAMSTNPLTINGNIYVHTGARFWIYTNQDVFLKGNINSNGEFICNSGTVVLNGTNQSLRMNTGNYFNNLTFNQSGTVTINNALSSIVDVKNNVVIQSGVFNMQDRVVHVGGNWTNTGGPTAFDPGTGRVTFYGIANQVCSAETFNILEVNKSGGNVIIPATTTCEIYDWKAGGITVNGGCFTANNLQQSAIFGSYILNNNGVINLHQDAYYYVDLNADITINSGTMNIYGGFPGSNSWWPSLNASLTMSGGVLDIKDQTIFVRDADTFISNITGGTIRTSKGYVGHRSDFNPTAGTFEFYGPDNAFISQDNSSTLHHVVIDKSNEIDKNMSTPVVTHCKRDGLPLSDGGKSGNISLYSNFTVTNNLDISSGSLDLAGKTLNVERDMHVYGTLIMTEENDQLNIGQSSFNWLWFFEGSTANITHGTIDCKGWVVPGAGSQFDLGIDNTIYFTGTTGGGLSSFEPTASYGNIVFAKNSGHAGYFDLSATQPAHVKGSFTVAPGNAFAIQNNSLIIDGTCDWDPTSSVYLANIISKEIEGNFFASSNQKLPDPKTTAYLELNSAFDLKGLLDVENGNVLLTNDFGIANTGILTISGGSFINNRPYDSFWTDIYGTLNMSDGLFELTYNHPQFYGSAATNISGGVIRTGGAFAAAEAPVFQPTGGTVEITGNQSGGAIYCFGGSFFHNLIINRSDFYSQFMLGYPVSIQNNFVVDNGEIRTGSSAISVSGNTTVNAGGKLVVNAGSSLHIAGNKSLTINDSGMLDVSGTAGNKAVISGISKSHYAFNVESGATISARNGIFEHMDVNGINIKPGALVQHDRAFTDCTFRNGQAGGSLLTINNNQEFSVLRADFPENTWGGLYNVAKTVNSGHVEFTYFTGEFAGSEFENDVYNRIDWFEPMLAADPLIRNVTPPAGTTTFEVISNLTWTVTESVSWLEVSHTWGSNNETITVTYDANPSPVARIGYITLSADYAPDVTLTVKQEGSSGIPVNLIVENETVNNSESECYDAMQTITVQNFVVESGGVANLVAGESIIMLPGTQAKAGSYLHAWITTTAEFCSSIKSMLAAYEPVIDTTPDDMPHTIQLPDTEKDRPLFRIFPNPTTGLFTLELAETPANQTLSMEIYTLVGERVMSEQLFGDTHHQFDLSLRPKGIYIVRVTVGDQAGIEKLIKH